MNNTNTTLVPHARYTLEREKMTHLEALLCRLESMGAILTALCDPDHKPPEISSLADLGRVISRDAMEGLDLMAEAEPLEELHFRDGGSEVEPEVRGRETTHC